MNLFENLQLMKESNSIKTEGIFKKNINVLCVKKDGADWEPTFWSTDMKKVRDKQKELQNDKNYKNCQYKICDRKEAQSYDKSFEKSTGNLDESKIVKDEKDIEQIVESAQLRRFTGSDSWTWGGATNFADGEPPMIAESDFATLIVSGPDCGDDEGATVSIYYGDPESEITEYGFKCYDNKELALKDAKILIKLLDDEVDEAQLSRFGFEIMSFR